MRLIILDEEFQELAKVDFSNSYERKVFDINPDVPSIDKKEEVLFNHFDYGIGVFSPTDKLDDFYISFLNESSLAFVPYTINDIKGTLASESVFSFNDDKVVLNKLKDVYDTSQSENIYFEFYNDEFLFKRLKLKIFKFDDFIYLLGKDETDYNIFSMKKNRFIEDYPQAIAIIQDNKIVKCNRKYLEIESSRDIVDIIDNEIDFDYFNINSEQIKKINNTINNILEQKSYTESMPLEIRKNDMILYYFNLNFIYILYNNKPAIIIFFEDLTKETIYQKQLEKALQETIELNDNLKGIQHASKTFISYSYDLNNIYWTPEVYKVLEINKDYKNKNNSILEDFLSKKDLIHRKKILSNLSLSNPDAKFVQRIKTQKGKYKYIQTLAHDDYDSKGKLIRRIGFNQDITAEMNHRIGLEKALRETMELNDSLERIQHASKTYITYTYDLKHYYGTSEVFNILEVDPEKNKDKLKDILNFVMDFIVEEDKELVETALLDIKPSNPNITGIIRIITGKGNLKYLKCVIHYYYDEKGKFIKSIGFNQDITEEVLYQKQLEQALQETNELNDNIERIHKIQNTSKTAIGYSYDLKDFSWTPEIYEILEINPEKYKNKQYVLLNDFVSKEDNESIEQKVATISQNNPEITFTQKIITGKGNIKYLKTFIHHDYDDEGNFIKSLISNQDITKEVLHQKQLEKALQETKELNDNLERIQHASKTYITYSYDLKHYSGTPEVCNILEIDPEKYKDKLNNMLEFIMDFILDEDKELVKNTIFDITPDNPIGTATIRVKTGKGNLKYLRCVVHSFYDENNKFVKGIGFNQDVTQEVMYQKQLETALKDKQILLSEVHHRVKNNLQIILSLIDLNLNFDTDIKNILTNTQNRIYAMALIHEKIYESDSLSAVNLKNYIESLVESLIELYESDINFISDIEPIELEMEESIPIGLMINEMITNTIKYAFPNKKNGNLYIKFKEENNHYTLIVKDDGIGLPEDLDIENLTSLGLIVITNLTLQIGGTFSILDCEGTGYKIEFEK